MRILILSDLHIEFASFTPPKFLDYDVVVLAGDIHNPGHKALFWARRESVFGPDVPIVYVAGNHEFYGTAMDTEIEEITAAAKKLNVHFLNADEVIIGGVRFLGATLWTDFRAPLVHEGVTVTDVGQALQVATRRLADFKLIEVPFQDFGRQRVMDGQRMGAMPTRRLRPFTAVDSMGLHWVERSWLKRKLSEKFDGPTVVVTHHSPLLEGANPNFPNDPLTPVFISDCSELFDDNPPDLFIYGHTHSSLDIKKNGCRVITNPRGYPLRSGKGYENPNFNPGLIVEV